VENKDRRKTKYLTEVFVHDPTGIFPQPLSTNLFHYIVTLNKIFLEEKLIVHL